MASVSVAEVKGQLSLLEPDFDPVLSRMIDAADDWVKAVGVAEEDLSRPAVQQAVILLVKHWFDHSITLGDNEAATVPPVVRALIAPFREVLS